MQESFELTPEECVRLLAVGVVGRIAFATPAGPQVLPVNYAVVEDSIVVRTDPDSLLGRQDDGTLLAFEIDHVDHDYHRGWSVVVRGPLEWVDDDTELREISRIRPPRSWALGPSARVLRLRWTEVSGRRLGAGWDPLESLSTRRIT